MIGREYSEVYVAMCGQVFPTRESGVEHERTSGCCLQFTRAAAQLRRREFIGDHIDGLRHALDSLNSIRGRATEADDSNLVDYCNFAIDALFDVLEGQNEMS